MTERENEVLNGIIEVLVRYLAPARIILFGSRAKEKNFKNSDFDLAIDMAKVDIRLQRKIDEEIENVVGLYKYDIVYLDSVDETFKNIVLQTGKVIYEKGNQLQY
ncbi:MAG: nucleotidyltransferase domain-containing protein [Elusimicrobiota bacterium]